MAIALLVSGVGNLWAQTPAPFLREKSSFEGTTVSSLPTFVPNGTTYTLELTGCVADQEITVPGGSFSYTPTASGTVRFVRNGGEEVYVYEGTTYKGTVSVSTPDAPTYPTGLTTANAGELNLIQNGGFEDITAGTYSSGRYKPTHWTPYKSDKGTPGDGTSVRSGSEITGSYNMLMHADGYYLTQQLASGVMKNFTPYQISFKYKANADGQKGTKYRFDVGSEEFKSDYFKSAESNSSTTSVQTFTKTFITPADIVNQPYVELYSTTNKGSGSSQKLDRFDEFILVAANGGGIGITGATGASFLSGFAYAPEGAFGAATSYSLASPYSTSLVTNGTFESNANGWTTTTGASGKGTASNQAGAFTEKFWENWNGTAFTGKMYQSVENIPNGTYKLNICAFVNVVDAEKGQYVYAGSNKSYVYTTTPTAYTVYACVTDGTLEYGLNQSTAVANWMGIDNVSLEYCGASDVTTEGFKAIYEASTNHLDDDDYANVTGEEKTNLQTAVGDTPEATIDGYATASFNIGYADYIFMNAKDSYDGLATARTTGATYTTELWPYASASKEKNLDNAVKAVAPETAADAVTKTNAITTAIRQFVESNGLCEGLSTAVDYTSYIKDANCDATTGWTLNGAGESSGETISVKSAEQYTKGDGTTSGSYLDGGWSTSAACNQTASQAVTLPAGTYQIQITARSNCSTFTLQIGDNSPINLPNVGSTGGTFGNGWSDVRGTFTSDGTALTITIHGEGSENKTWMSFDRIRLIRTDATIATSEDYLALNNAISEAENKLGFEKDENAPYNNSGIFPLLATAKGFNQEISNAQDDVQNATTALTSFSWTKNVEELNAVYDGTFAAAENNGAPAGWTMSNNTLGGDKHSRAFVGDERLSEFNTSNSAFFLRFDGTNSTRGSLYYYGNADGYTMPLKSDTYYRLTVDFAGWGSTGKPLRLNVAGPTGFDAVYCDINTSVQADTEANVPQRFDIIFYASVAGNYQLYFQTPGSDDNTHMVVVSNIELFKCPAASATMTVKANKWGTFIAPFDVTIPTGVNAYTVTGVSENTIVKSDALETTIPANTPVILENTTESLISQEFNGQNISTADSYTVGLLTGVYTAETIAASTEPTASDPGAYRYVLQTPTSGENEGKQAFYKVTSAFTATAYRCYLSVDIPATGEGVKAFYLDGDETAVSSVKADELQGATIYNLAGQRVSKAQKGVYIINGKKVAVK